MLLLLLDNLFVECKCRDLTSVGEVDEVPGRCFARALLPFYVYARQWVIVTSTEEAEEGIIARLIVLNYSHLIV